MPHHRWRHLRVGLVAALVICAFAACAVTGMVVPQRSVAAFGVDQQIGSMRVLGYGTWNADCPPFTGCEPTSNQSYVVWVIAEQPNAASGVRNSRRILAVPLELWR